MEKIKEEEFLFGDEELISIFGKEYLDKLKKDDYKAYVNLRNCPAFMPSDIVPTKAEKEKKAENKYNN